MATDSGALAFLYNNGVVTSLGTLGGTNSFAYGVNSALQVAGSSLKADNVTTHAFLWQNSAISDLNALLPYNSGWELMEAHGINDYGSIAGWGETHQQAHAFLYYNGGWAVDLGTLTGGTNSYALGLNRSNVVVGASSLASGSHAVMWRGGNVTDLNSLITIPGWELKEATGINDAGEIVGWGLTKWVWADDGRRERLCRLYNDTFNHSRVRTFNGEHLTLPGASAAVQLHAHQKSGVWRILQTPNTLLGHVVGAGKTFTMVAAAMELKRLGLARKPMFTVPNHMLGQFSTELLMLYPGANILVAGKEDFEAQNRRKLFSRIATGNWDAVIATHSGFERIPLSHETQVRFFQEQLDELDKIKREHAGDENRRLVKEIEKAKKRLEAKLQFLAAEHKKDNTLTFEELGVDRLFVDEAHYFKNLFYVSEMTRIAGLPQTASERAFDMYLKVRHVQSVNSGGGVVFATGTPIANSMAEMFTMQRYLQPQDLQKHNLHHFDGWAATFGEPVTAMELSPDGAGYRLNTRFARFVNVPELMQIFRQAADVQTAQMLNLPRPKLEGEKPAICHAPASEELKKFVEGLAKRAEALKRGRVDPREDNMLKITTEGRKAALDLRLMKPSLPDDPQSKVNLAVENIHRIWETTKTDHLTQLVFCDLSTPQDRGFSVYRDMADKLKRLGVPEPEIAFIQDYDADSAKLGLFRSVRAGKVRVLFGSTQKMGSGTNVQERLVALHHLDAPWRPADVERKRPV